jgi:hypothetical protein
MKKTQNIIGKHLVGVRLNEDQLFYVFDTKKKANECVKTLREKYPLEDHPELEIIQTVKAVK